MGAVRFLFSPAGRLDPQTFIVAVIVVYLAGAASNLLTRPDAVARGGLWLFAFVQALLVWIWLSLHARRLHDAGRGAGPAAAAALLYTLATVLLIIVAASFYGPLAGGATNGDNAGALGLILIVSVIAVLLGSAHYDLGWLVVAAFVAMALLPVILVIGVTLFAASRPRQDGPAG